MKQAKKRHKTHEEARSTHKALQARRDALARLRRGEIVEICLARARNQDGALPPEIVTARALGKDEDPEHYKVLAIINRRLRAGWCFAKDGLRVGPRRLDTKDILGVVLLVGGMSPYEGEGSFLEQLRARIEEGTKKLEKKDG